MQQKDLLKRYQLQMGFAITGYDGTIPVCGNYGYFSISETEKTVYIEQSKWVVSCAIKKNKG